MMTGSKTVQDTPAIAIEGLSRRFGSKLALDNVTLTVPHGCVFGLLGETGAGKTTLIKHIMGLMKPQAGRVRVFGLDPIADPVRALGRVGYLSEDRDLPKWMRLDELMRYTQGYYPNWDPHFAEELLRRFDLDPTQRVKTLSKGQTAKTGLLVALAHRPDLLVLDEPSSGLDPLVRRHILSAVMRNVAEEGRTLLFSSHLLDEVERVADYVAIINRGRVVMCDKLETILKKHRLLTLHFDADQHRVPAAPGIVACTGSGRDWTALCDGKVDELRARIASLNARIIKEVDPSLEDIFISIVEAQFAAEESE